MRACMHVYMYHACMVEVSQIQNAPTHPLSGKMYPAGGRPPAGIAARQERAAAAGERPAGASLAARAS